MKKSLLTVAAVVVTVLILLATLTSCLAFPGTSAYDIAVKNGFVGTEAEWLASLKGADGSDGEYAAKGDSAYDIAVKNGFTGTESEWLASLKGTSASGQDVSSATSKAITSGVAIIASYKYHTTSFGVTKAQYGGGAGSGVIVKDTGSAAYIVTNYHVVYGEKAETENNISERIWVYFYGSLYPQSWTNAISNENYKQDAVDASYVGGSLSNDIAVLKLSGVSYIKFKSSGATVAETASSALVAAGDTAIAIGNPEGLGLSATSGIVSVDSEMISVEIKTGVRTDLRVMRIDTAVNGGNSGGGLFDADGSLIGIVNAKTSDASIENISYAIPSDTALAVAGSIIDNENTAASGKATKMVLGITVQATGSKAVRQQYKTYEVIAANNADGYEIVEKTSYRTVVVNEITVKEIGVGSIADIMGLKLDDVLLSVSIGGKEYPINRTYTLGDALYKAREGQSLVLTVQRAGATKSLMVNSITSAMIVSVD